MGKYLILKSVENITALSINGKDYDLEKFNDYSDQLVIKQKKELLGQIDLNELTDNLYLSVELLYVAYNGVAGAQGGKLQADINTLMGDMAILCNECVTTMVSFETESENIISQLGQTYRWLLKGNEKLAIKKLQNCGASSEKMASSADNLSEKFLKLQERSVKVRSHTILEEGSENDKKEAAKKAIRELESTRKTEKINQEGLLEQVSNIQVLYEEAKEREQQESDKAMIMAITSAITGAIGAGLGAYVAVQNPLTMLLPKSGNNKDDKELQEAIKKQDDTKKALEEKQAELKDIEADLELTEGKLKKCKNDENELGKKINTIEEKEESSRKDEEKEGLQELKHALSIQTKEINELNVEVEKQKVKVKDVKKVSTDYTALFNGASVALTDISEKMKSMATQAASAQESIHKEKMEFLNRKFKLEDEKRKSLVMMQEFTEEINNAKVDEGHATLSVNSLHAAVGAMGKIVGTLTNASLFWKQMAGFCTKMHKKGFQQELKDLIDPENGVDKDDRIKEYQDVNFMTSFLTYLCQWIALNGLSGEYLVSATNAKNKCVENLSKSPSIEEAIRAAPELAKSMSIMLTKKIKESDEQTLNIQKEKARLTITTNDSVDITDTDANIDSVATED
jgi:hypothetical protein